MATLSQPLRVLFCGALRDEYFRAGAEERHKFVEASFSTRNRLLEELDITVLGTLDDDRVRKGASGGWPWTWYILADVPDYDTVQEFMRAYSQTLVDDDVLMWRYVSMEARIGRPLPVDRCVIEEIPRPE